MNFFDFFKSKKHKSADTKRAEIFFDYSVKLTEILQKYENNPQVQKTKKIEFLSKVNSELSRNIYFDRIQIEEIIGRLALL